MTSGPPSGAAAPPAPDAPGLLAAHCCCPACHGPLTWSPDTVACAACHRVYRREEGIPVFTTFDADSSAAEVRYKLDQAEFFDGEAAEWEIDRPYGAAAFYGWLMIEKFRRSIQGIEALLPGATVLTVCGGSGMDAEFLARRGARVISSDISLGAAKRVRERARRRGLEIVPIVADVEQLPFADRAVAVAYVHDGLHHLGDPDRGLAEMLRVADRAVAVTEPVRAAATALAVRVGLALDREEAGNRVERLDPLRTAALVRAAGFRVVGSERYAMFYRHHPGAAVRALSRPRLLPIAADGLRRFNRVLGRMGNKGALRAVRDRGELS